MALDGKDVTALTVLARNSWLPESERAPLINVLSPEGREVARAIFHTEEGAAQGNVAVRYFQELRTSADARRHRF